MTNVTIDDFVKQIIAMNAVTPGMGSAATGIWGFPGIGNDTINVLKRDAISFASAYKKHSDTTKIANQIDASLNTLLVLEAITRKQFDTMTDELASFKS